MGSIPTWVWMVGLGVGLPFLLAYSRVKEAEANEKTAPPEDRQVRWHISHIREDVRLIAYLLAGILVALIYQASR